MLKSLAIYIPGYTIGSNFHIIQSPFHKKEYLIVLKAQKAMFSSHYAFLFLYSNVFAVN